MWVHNIQFNWRNINYDNSLADLGGIRSHRRKSLAWRAWTVRRYRGPLRRKSQIWNACVSVCDVLRFRILDCQKREICCLMKTRFPIKMFHLRNSASLHASSRTRYDARGLRTCSRVHVFTFSELICFFFMIIKWCWWWRFFGFQNHQISSRYVPFTKLPSIKIPWWEPTRPARSANTLACNEILSVRKCTSLRARWHNSPVEVLKCIVLQML